MSTRAKTWIWRTAAAVVLLLPVSVIVVLGIHSGWGAEQNLYPARAGNAPADFATELVGSEPVSFLAPDGIVLAGTYLASQNGAAVVLAHGYGSDRRQLLPEARILARSGYGILLFDARAHGESGGSISTWGDREGGDLARAVDYLAERSQLPPGRIGALGFSAGGTAVIREAATDQRLQAIVIEATFTSVADEFRSTFGRYGALSAQPAVWALQLSGIDTAALEPERQLCALAPRPVLLVYGTRDTSAPEPIAYRMSAAACEPKSLLMIDTDQHGGYSVRAPRQYATRLTLFFDAALGVRSKPVWQIGNDAVAGDSQPNGNRASTHK